MGYTMPGGIVTLRTLPQRQLSRPLTPPGPRVICPALPSQSLYGAGILAQAQAPPLRTISSAVVSATIPYVRGKA